MSVDKTVPTQGQLRAFMRRVSPPENEVPAVVPVHHALVRLRGLALSLLGARVSTTTVLLQRDLELQQNPTRSRQPVCTRSSGP